ncbi:class II aldolase/adducin family protein [Butyrivibrio sp. NC3005]|uniref:class II aldolase/adducin family protein n=1 Tax=Butyrivibrio sp. NC3005 TaxID=1280685 RepID=UPI00040A2DAA|nr:class II aldolase/adducin family protein [Butyrivibrio sp. NC3005]
MDKREELIEVGKWLHENELLVRTWGNVSCRIDENHMLITPSGIRYEDLTKEMIVKVNINDLSYEGEYKPSSELRVHAACYKNRRGCNFIVHTHQMAASISGTLGLKIVKGRLKEKEFKIPCVKYALCGTQKLADNLTETLNHFIKKNGFILSGHGVICLGEDAKAALKTTINLEMACQDFLRKYCRIDFDIGFYKGYNSELVDGNIVYEQEDTPLRVKKIHEEIYSKRPDVKAICHNKSEACRIVSRRATYMRPLLEDFAQLIGVGVRIPLNNSGRDGKRIIIKKHVNAVFVLDDGVYCLGDTKENAFAAALVMEKGCIAQIAAFRYGSANVISSFDCMRLNRVYRLFYSKIADEVQ